MDDQLMDQKLQEALKLFDEGKTFSGIRDHFKDELNKESISYIIRLVDEFSIEESRILAEIKKAKFKIILGIVSFAISALLLYSFYINDALSGPISLLAYLPMAFSLYLIWKGYKERNLLMKTAPEIDDSKFQMKRRRKK